MFLMLLVLWLIFNGRVTLELLLVGAAVSAGITVLWLKIFSNARWAVVPLPRSLGRYLRYIGELLVEIVRCNLLVLRLTLHPGEEVHPKMVTFCHGLKKESHKVMLANSITLTPGTITVGLRPGAICVHGLDASFLEGIESCDMLRRLKEIEEAEGDE